MVSQEYDLALREQSPRALEVARLDHSVSPGENWESSEHRDAVSRALLIIVNGEGILHSNRPGARRIVAAAPFAASLSIPSVSMNTAWGRNSGDMTRDVRRFPRVVAREAARQTALLRAGIDAEVVHNMTFPQHS